MDGASGYNQRHGGAFSLFGQSVGNHFFLPLAFESVLAFLPPFASFLSSACVSDVSQLVASKCRHRGLLPPLDSLFRERGNVTHLPLFAVVLRRLDREEAVETTLLLGGQAQLELVGALANTLLPDKVTTRSAVSSK